jgi:AcrR family transcriptional regulator
MMRKKKPHRRLNHGEARDRILRAAEKLFAVDGYDAVSFRDLTDAAGVSLSAIHYHFGSKQAVLSEIFARRAALLTNRRLELLEAAHRYSERRPSLESILDAFLRPAFEVTRGDRNDLFNRLRARVSLEHGATTRKIVSRAFDDNDLRFIEELKTALPDLSYEDVHWRFHFLVGAMLYTMSDSGQLEGLSGRKCQPTQTDVALQTMITTFASLFRSPSTGQFRPNRSRLEKSVSPWWLLSDRLRAALLELQQRFELRGVVAVGKGESLALTLTAPSEFLLRERNCRGGGRKLERRDCRQGLCLRGKKRRGEFGPAQNVYARNGAERWRYSEAAGKFLVAAHRPEPREIEIGGEQAGIRHHAEDRFRAGDDRKTAIEPFTVSGGNVAPGVVLEHRSVEKVLTRGSEHDVFDRACPH